MTGSREPAKVAEVTINALPQNQFANRRDRQMGLAGAGAPEESEAHFDGRHPLIYVGFGDE
jgi:hypothetical protein